jgi:hypothetical protein
MFMQFRSTDDQLMGAVCPEHEHWQQRTQINPITVSNNFKSLDQTHADYNTPTARSNEITPETNKHRAPEEAIGPEEGGDEDELEVLPPILTDRDMNVA